MGEVYQLDATFSAEVEDDTILLKWPLQTKKIEVNSIVGYYVYPFITDKNTLVIAYNNGEKKKLLKLVLATSLTDSFIEKLKKIAPLSANLLDKEKSEALQILGTKDRTKLIILFVLTVIIPITIVGIHFLMQKIY